MRITFISWYNITKPTLWHETTTDMKPCQLPELPSLQEEFLETSWGNVEREDSVSQHVIRAKWSNVKEEISLLAPLYCTTEHQPSLLQYITVNFRAQPSRIAVHCAVISTCGVHLKTQTVFSSSFTHNEPLQLPVALHCLCEGKLKTRSSAPFSGFTWLRNVG